jgi:hypothetical protein
MRNVSTAALRKRRAKLLRDLPPLARVLRGSLLEKYKRCGRPFAGCSLSIIAQCARLARKRQFITYVRKRAN